MRSGRLRHRIVIERATESQNAVGEPVQTWSALKTVWGSIEPTAGKERYSAMQVQGEVINRIVCRHHSAIADLSIKDRITHGSKVYDIKSVINMEERNIQFELFVKQHL